MKDPSSIERDPRQEIDVEDSGCPELQEKTVDGLYDNRKTMLGGPYIISSKTSEEHDATPLLLLIKYYYSLPPPYEFLLVKDKVPPDKAEGGIIIETETQYLYVGLKLYDGVKMFQYGKVTKDGMYFNVSLVSFSVLTLDLDILLYLQDDFNTLIYVRSNDGRVIFGTLLDFFLMIICNLQPIFVILYLVVIFRPLI